MLDANARQVWLPLTPAPDEDADNSTEYQLQLPAQPATIDRLRLDFDGEFFDRPYQLFATADGTVQFVAKGPGSRTFVQVVRS